MGTSSLPPAWLIEMACWKAANFFVTVALLAGSATAAEGRRVAFFGFFLINASLQPTQPAEEERLEMLDTVLRDQLAGAGRFSFVAIPQKCKSRPSSVLASRLATDVRGTFPAISCHETGAAGVFPARA
jgi:hypothetical protein